MAVNLPLDLEKQAQEEAARQGVDTDTFVIAAVRRKLRRMVREDDELPATHPNEGMVEALREIAERQKGRRATSGEATQRLLRAARAGGMYGLPSDDEQLDCH